MADHRLTTTMAVDLKATRAATRTGTAVSTVTVGLAAASWAVVVWQMRGMDMGVGTELGSFGFFTAAWVSMMAAMMLPGAAPAVVRHVQARGRVRAVPPFVGSYLAVWAFVGVGVYALYRPHGSAAAAAVVIAAGLNEITPLKRHFRRGCRDAVGSGFAFGGCCVGSSIGLMLVALGVMSVTWMAAITVVVLAQKLLPAKTAIDVPEGLAIVGLGIWILLAPASVPGLTPPT